jgi:hypothetical protein
VAFHEEPARVEHDSLEVVDVVHLADRVAAESAPNPFQTPASLDEERLLRLGIDARKLAKFREDAQSLLGHTRELLK